MKGTSLAFCLLFAAPLSCYAGEQLIPAGSLIQCTISEPKLSARTTAIGDPVLCRMGHSERYGRSVLPYNSYLVGRFEDYKDPGHFVGKGWMELRFDRMVIEPDTIIPVDAKVVAAPGFNVDRDGRILGKGHAVRDTVLWSIPILWPVDLLMLPMRGPRPALKQEERLTLKVMDDLGIPMTEPMQRDPSGLIRRSPSAYAAPPPAPTQDAPQNPVDAMYDPMDAAPAPPAYPDVAQAPPAYPDAAPAPPAYGYAAPPPVYGYAAPLPVYGYAAPRPAYGYAAPRPAYGYAAPRAAYGYGARPPVNRYAAPRPGNGYAASRPGYGYGAPRAGYGYAAPRAGSGYAAPRASYGYSAPQQRMGAGWGQGRTMMAGRGGMAGRSGMGQRASGR